MNFGGFTKGPRHLQAQVRTDHGSAILPEAFEHRGDDLIADFPIEIEVDIGRFGFVVLPCSQSGRFVGKGNTYSIWVLSSPWRMEAPT
jgi:hypothetical protein